MKKLSNILLAFLFSFPAYAQDAEMADTMRSEGKIYVVVAIVLLILCGLIAYLALMDRKVSRLEKKLSDRNPS